MSLTLALGGFIAVGISLGLLGGGGSILAVPVLVHLLGIAPRVAVPMSLPIVGAAAAGGAIARWRRGQLRLRLVAPFALITIVASYSAAHLGLGIADRPRMIIFGVTMFTAAFAMWRRASRMGSAEVLSPQRSLLQVVPAGLAVGALTGVVGVGGGFLIVPALTGVLGLPMAEATATSLAVIALNTVAAGWGYVGHVQLDARLTAIVIAAALVGMAIGTRLAPRVPARTLTRAFAVLLVVLAIFMLGKEVG
jgi:uncharacterized membrane protein YfcA